MEAELDCAAVAGIVEDALKDVLGADGFDVIPDAAGAFVDIAADEWTLRIEGTSASKAWLSIEDEPEQQSELSAARRAVMSTEVDAALAAANVRSGGALVSMLRASFDPLTLDLADSLTVNDG
jgi:hypothetical protein